MLVVTYKIENHFAEPELGRTRRCANFQKQQYQTLIVESILLSGDKGRGAGDTASKLCQLTHDRNFFGPTTSRIAG